MPLADKTSRVCATRRMAKVFSNAHDSGTPLLYHILNQDGDVRQMMFFDHMKNYDVHEFLIGPFCEDEEEDYTSSHDNIYEMK